ncbi:unnamed protein product [Trifolium pratense]|uniref:Uncharacterized protein n=1 Tax=Trifolium pratense TaxID=57577 RepID=A0ACB0KUS6_TRIPR|nr:unnamed protein product [Trifolium pratense]
MARICASDPLGLGEHHPTHQIPPLPFPSPEPLIKIGVMGIPETRWGYPIPVGYGFGVIIFIPARIWDGFWVWVWGGQNSSPPRPIALPKLEDSTTSEKM